MTDIQKKTSRHVMMMAAGTGGHVFPALAVSKQLQQQGHHVSWLATPTGMENRLLQQHQIPIYQINIQGVRGNGIIRKLVAPFKILAATWQAMRYMKQLKVDAVAGFGGYVAGPGGLAAKLLGIPIIIHEQNAVAGFTNTQLARFAKTVCQAFPHTFAEQAKVVTTGNPVRADIVNIADPVERYAQRDQHNQALRILVVGGSLGAQALNQTVPQALAQLQVPLQVFHQCGQGKEEMTREAYASANANIQVEVHAFIEDMAQAYASADLIICRAGALTVTEVATAGIAAIFVPLPSAVDDHQTQNAKFLADTGAAKICPQSSMTPDHLQQLLQPLLDRQVLKQMAIQARQCAQANATQRVVDLIQEL